MTTDLPAATYRALHAASTAARHLRDGLTPHAAAEAARDLRPLLDVDAVALADARGLLAWEGAGERHRTRFTRHVRHALDHGTPVRLDETEADCGDPTCPIRSVVVAPVVADGTVVAALGSYHHGTEPSLAAAMEAVAGWISSQLDLSELERQRARAVEAELRALRAQIDPHFVYNSLTAIASFVRTDPERARDLILDFADFTRYGLRSGSALTTLADELVNVEHYLALEAARFGDRMQVTVQIAPEILGVQVPPFAVQPLVENAVRHGIEAATGVGTIRIEARAEGPDAVIVVADDGAGADPERIRAILRGEVGDGEVGDHVGMGNVDARLRAMFGDDRGLVVDTAPGTGTRVSFRIPRGHGGVAAAS